MKYPIAIEKGDQLHSYGVVVPDLPGCFSAGDTLDEAFENAKEAIAGWIEVELDEGNPIPEPSDIDRIAENPEFKGWILALVEVDLNKLSDKIQRINITLPSKVLRKLDVLAHKSGDSRSGYISRLVLKDSYSL